MATVTVPNIVPSPTDDAEQLRKAFAGWGTNEDLIITILAHRSAVQRRLIRQAYADTYGRNDRSMKHSTSERFRSLRCL